MANRFFTIGDLTHLPKPVWLIEGMFEVNALVMVAGPPASFKSFMVLDWILNMASGRDWNNRPTSLSRVLYVLGEGKSSLLKRIQAWKTVNNLTETEKKNLEENFRVSFEVPQMALKPSVDNMLAQLENEGFKPNVIAVDTFARSFVGLDENSQKDTGLWVENADRLRNLGYSVIFLHHTAKNTEFGLSYRGSSAIMGAMDTAFTMERQRGYHNRVVLKTVKQKDHDEGEPIFFQTNEIKGLDADPEGSITLTRIEAPSERFNLEDKLSRKLMVDKNFRSDRGRAMALANATGLTEQAAQSRISRLRKDMKLEEKVCEANFEAL